MKTTSKSSSKKTKKKVSKKKSSSKKASLKPSKKRIEPKRGKRIAAIDVGSNGIRMVIGEIQKDSGLKAIYSQREAVRLGRDVFRDGYIRESTARKALRAFLKFKKVLTEYGIKNYRAVATSAVRDALNGREFVKYLKELSSLNLEVIDGVKEGKLIHMAITTQIPLMSRMALLIDIGGGSVELTVSHYGKIMAVETFRLGTVRLMNQTDMFFFGSKLRRLESILKKQSPKLRQFLKRHLGQRKDFVMIGTGGNIECLGDLSSILKDKSAESMSFASLKAMVKTLDSMTYDERIKSLGLRTDRADVILPAALALRMVMGLVGAKDILIPHVGLKDGVLIDLARRVN